MTTATQEIPVEVYSVIYSAEWNDRTTDVRVRDVAPPKVRKLWDLTECDYDPCEFATRQRKWCALLTPAEFDEFVRHCCLVASETETMGMLGGPGFGWGWSPAICFEGDDYSAWTQAYVCPIPLGDPGDYSPTLADPEGQLIPPTENEIANAHAMLWERMRAQVLEQYGY